MALENSLHFNFTAVQQAAIKANLNAARAVLNEPTVPYVNLTRDERKVSSIDAVRLPYVHDAVDNILPEFPNLASVSIDLPRTTTLLQLVEFVRTIKPIMDELSDRFTDLSINAEYLVYKSMTDSYETAQRQEGRIEGADVLRAAIAPLFAGQGNQGTGPQPSPTEPNNPNPPAPTPGDGTTAP